ncbi:hypothetical protein TNCV_1432781 [Trichonephila clavipes]|nr:hypothetical protein TNCV_1432781 [Trichonephila clavipes]
MTADTLTTAGIVSGGKKSGSCTNNETDGACEKDELISVIMQYDWSDTDVFNSLHTIDIVKGLASFLPLACGFVCVRFTLPSPHPIDSVKGHATLSLPLLTDSFHPTVLRPVLNCCIQRL